MKTQMIYFTMQKILPNLQKKKFLFKKKTFKIPSKYYKLYYN